MVSNKPNPAPADRTPQSSDRGAQARDQAARLQQLLRTLVADQRDLENYYSISFSRTRIQRLGEFLAEHANVLVTRFFFYEFDQDGKVDWSLAVGYVLRRQQQLRAEWARAGEMAPLLSWAGRLVELCEARQAAKAVEWQSVARVLSEAGRKAVALKGAIEGGEVKGVGRFLAFRAVKAVVELCGHMEEWGGFYKDYDPLFDWWAKRELDGLLPKMQELVSAIRVCLIGIGAGEEDAIVGLPCGRERLLEDLKAEVVPYSPEEIIKIGETEYKWCEREMIEASRELRFGDKWKRALEHVKGMYVEPGKQIQMVHELAEEAIEYVTKHDMITVPQVAREAWRTFMMAPEAQKTNPFFLGGDSILVSYPTSAMSYEFKNMIMRGNNKPFSRSTVFHELIPGHHLQFYYTDRYKTYRRPFMTPFWTEGWAFYWEMILWDRGFAHTPEYKIGMLFWRMHRCLRIIFSLKFHLGQMTPEECIDLLVKKGGHERATAEGEVRRSFNGDYTPLYQAGYMLGALQFYALRKEVLDAKFMTEKEFHDRVLQENNMPVEMVRALLKNAKLERRHQPSWRFYGDVDGEAISPRMARAAENESPAQRETRIEEANAGSIVFPDFERATAWQK